MFELNHNFVLPFWCKKFDKFFIWKYQRLENCYFFQRLIELRSVDMDGSLEDSDGIKDLGSKKRGRSDSSAPSSSKACRVKQRRDRLNDKFVELGSILEPGRPPKTDKAAILTDVVRMVSQLRSEAQKLKDSNSSILLGASALIAFLVSAVFHEIW